MARNIPIQVRRDTSANWTSVNPMLLAGELGFESDTNKLKVGTGVTWTATGYLVADASLTINDTFVLGSQAAMLASATSKGDFVIRTDVGKTFILQNEPASTLSNWIELPSTGSAAVNMTGATSGAAGTAGYVPAPVAGDNVRFLTGAGTFAGVDGGSA
jgi:Major tropism determinant N-terminal domain